MWFPGSCGTPDRQLPTAKGGAHATPLHAALTKGHFYIVLLLLEHGASVNALDDDMKSPLHGASERGRCDIVEFFYWVPTQMPVMMRYYGMKNTRLRKYRDDVA
jgi:hypothetical protein